MQGDDELIAITRGSADYYLICRRCIDAISDDRRAARRERGAESVENMIAAARERRRKLGLPENASGAAARLAERRALVWEAKDRPCMDCGGRFPPVAMDFDHRPGEVKLDDISKLMQKASNEALIAEMAKCDLVCANCHRVRTAQRQEWQRQESGQTRGSPPRA